MVGIYQTVYLGIGNTITFNSNTGTLEESLRKVETGNPIGKLPIPTKTEYEFLGWFTTSDGGDEINAETIITNDVEYFAHWRVSYVAEINGEYYKTLQAALNEVPTTNVQTTVKLLKNVKENISISANKNIVFDLQNYTIKNSSDAAVITNYGTVYIYNGTITSASASASAINNKEGGKFKISGGSIIATGKRQAIYNEKGVVEITGNAYLSSSITVTDKPRGTVHNLASSTIKITGGTIVSTTQQAVYNEGILDIGTKDGNINVNSPIIQGLINGIKSSIKFNLFDGIIKGKTAAISDESKIDDKETNSILIHQTELIEEQTYQTAYLEITE